MIQNAFTKAKYGGRLSFTRRLPLCTSLSSRSALRPVRNAVFNLHLPPTTRPLSQGRFQTTGLTSLDYEFDTIYALSTAPGRAAIAIIRISGLGWWDIYQALCPGQAPPKPRKATLRDLYDPSDSSNILDSALVLHFPAPKTVTGEDILELHIHGGHATVKAVLAAIAQSPSAHTIRYAEAGEFTRRAFQNDRLDLGQVEALSDALSAETEQQRRAAIRGNSGKLGRIYEEWRQLLLAARGELEALIDFSEDQHFDESPAELMRNVTRQIGPIVEAIRRHRAGSRCGELLKRGIRISLLGPPNAGKSSLLNVIVDREASIVSEEAGTTRDVVEVSVDIGGYLCVFADTAGLRSSEMIGGVEQEGIRRAKAKARDSDLIIVLASVEQSDSSNSSVYQLASGPSGLSTFCDLQSLKLAAEAEQEIVVINKCDSTRDLGDLIVCTQSRLNDLFPGNSPPIVAISCRDADSSGGGIRNLVDVLQTTFGTMTSVVADDLDLLGVSERQSQLLSSCTNHLESFKDEALQGDECDIVIAAEHLRAAATCLARITGRGEAGDVEEVLGVVFEKFCVGK
ncbi:P-loop containing nucleoside triphosphate hydrolase protein [Hyaloscypha variabilis F]|uniref:P-loop containing nucleoside triphosphate hydrolase protein n=1 Tax=Hyaloscypha variabilis (strain UAMH 11265 / GT02V1 / F) TaxID=1149755 RepID=A0A2J6RX91_HYAVF|nr:P-loop containing nucleoside triphosphate hydrolase protein [Hyaloscypha variabilis F]